MAEKKKNSTVGYLLIGLLLLALGATFIIFNDALKVVTIAVGILLVVFSAIYLVLTIASKDRGAAFAIKVVFGSIGVISGAVTAILNESAANIVISIFCLLLIVDASMKLTTAAYSKRFGVKAWWIIMAISTLTIGGAFYILKYTPENLVVATVMLGIVLALDGLSNITALFMMPALEKRAKSSIYYDMYRKEFEKD